MNPKTLSRRLRQALAIILVTLALFVAVSWGVHVYIYYQWEQYWSRSEDFSWRGLRAAASYATSWSKLWNFALLHKPRQVRWNYYVDRFKQAGRKFYRPLPPKYLKLIPNTEGYLFENRIRINAHGFRGPPLDAVKKRARVLCVGGSTTFGVTTAKDDKPYPEVLQDLLGKKFEVVNGGIYGHDIMMNFRELRRKFLPVRPDVIVIYQGWNDYDLMIQPFVARNWPEMILAIDIALFQGRWPNRAEYFYHRFIRTCLARGITVVLSTFAMEFNRNSPQRITTIYRRWMKGMLGKNLEFILGVIDDHNRMTHRLAAWYGLPLADVHGRLDGRPRYYMDWVHFNQQGRRLLARTIYEALRPILPALLAGWKRRKSSPAGRGGGAGSSR
jgi:lysophospholipase L1-like esterase